MHCRELYEKMPDVPESWEQRLRASGYRRIGHGTYAQVWAKPGDPFVLKVFREDEAYLRFINLITDHQDNPHFPRIRGRLTKIRDYWAIRIERLSRLAPFDIMDEMQRYRGAHNALRFGFTKGTLPSYIEQMTTLHQEFREHHPQLANALDLVFKVCDVQRRGVDWTEGNFRLRGKTVVMSDPLAW
jgi:hypothetical protein